MASTVEASPHVERGDGSRAMRLGAFAVFAIASAFGLALGYVATSISSFPAVDPELTLLLRLMALLKLVMAACGALLIDWRLRHAASAHLHAGYLASTAMMAVSPGLIWFGAHLIAAAAVFHAGLILGLMLALRDGRVLSGRWLGR